MAYHLEYVEKPGKFDEVVAQDGVKVLIDSKALFSIIGSEMDWQEDRMRFVFFYLILSDGVLALVLTDGAYLRLLSSKFVFKNPNITDACGCGESFNVAA